MEDTRRKIPIDIAEEVDLIGQDPNGSRERMRYENEVNKQNEFNELGEQQFVREIGFHSQLIASSQLKTTDNLNLFQIDANGQHQILGECISGLEIEQNNRDINKPRLFELEVSQLRNSDYDRVNGNTCQTQGQGTLQIVKQITKDKKKKKKLRTTFKPFELCPMIPEQLVFLLKGNVLLELNRNADDQDYVPIGFKTNPQNKWKPIQRVIEHNKHGCIEIQVDNLFKPEEDFTFIIKVLNSYGDSKYRNIALSLEKYQKIILGTKELENHMASQPQPQSDKAEDKTKMNKNINSPEYEKAFYDQFYERAMDVLGSMNKSNDKIFFAFTMGKFDKFGFYQDMYNFGVNTNFLWLLGSEMNSMSNIFMRNGWLEIFDQETRIQNSLNFVRLINHEFEAQQAKFQQNPQECLKQTMQEPTQSKLQESFSESIDIVVNSFDQIKIPAKLKIHDIKVNQFGLRIMVMDVCPTMIQQVHSIRDQQRKDQKQVNYIQMFDRKASYTSESQTFLEKFYSHRFDINNPNNLLDVNLLPSVRSSIDKMRCNFRLIPNQ